MPDLRNWLTEVWMSAGTGRVSMSRFSSDVEEQKQVLQKTVTFCVLKLNGFLLMIHISAHLKQLAVSPPYLAG